MQELDDQLVTAPTHPAGVVVALGSNLGDSASILATAIETLDRTPQIRVTAVSPLAKTAPVGGPEQPDFLNQVLLIETTLSPYALLEFAHDLEQAAARVRDVRWGPRTLDVDLIDFENVTSKHPDLTLPHPRAHQRAFVLAPWSWVDPTATINGQPVTELAAQAGDADTVHKMQERS